MSLFSAKRDGVSVQATEIGQFGPGDTGPASVFFGNDHRGIRHTSTLGWVLIGAGLLTSLIWLDSLERYLDARWHLRLDAWRPESLVLPSRWLAQQFQPESAKTAVFPPPAPLGMGGAPAPGGQRRLPASTASAASAASPVSAALATSAAAAPLSAGSGPVSLVAIAAPASAAASATVSAAASAAVSAAASAPSADTGPASPANLPAVFGTASLRAVESPAAGAPPWSVQPLPPGLFWPTVRQQRLAPGPQRIQFAGDSMMQGLAPLVIRDLAKRHPSWQMWDESRQSTGLTVKRYFDWPARIAQIVEQRQLSLVIVFLGPNDPWDLYETPGGRTVFPSPQWQARYASRVDEVITHAKAHQTRVIWVGLPAMREGRLRDGAILQNRIFAERARLHGTDYLSTEDLIGPVSRPFQRTWVAPPEASVGLAASGPAGVALRAEDGVHFTSAGLQRIQAALVLHIEATLR